MKENFEKLMTKVKWKSAIMENEQTLYMQNETYTKYHLQLANFLCKGQLYCLSQDPIIIFFDK